MDSRRTTKGPAGVLDNKSRSPKKPRQQKSCENRVLANRCGNRIGCKPVKQRDGRISVIPAFSAADMALLQQEA